LQITNLLLTKIKKSLRLELGDLPLSCRRPNARCLVYSWDPIYRRY